MTLLSDGGSKVARALPPSDTAPPLITVSSNRYLSRTVYPLVHSSYVVCTRFEKAKHAWLTLFRQPKISIINRFGVRVQVMRHCSEGGVVSPKTCVYLAEWLNLPNAEELF